MKLEETPRLPNTDDPLTKELTRILKAHATKVNQLAAGGISANDNTYTAVPASGTWLTGDYVKKSNPVEAGAPASKYVIKGWIRVTSGVGNVLNTDWLEDRALTGN